VGENILGSGFGEQEESTRDEDVLVPGVHWEVPYSGVSSSSHLCSHLQRRFVGSALGVSSKTGVAFDKRYEHIGPDLIGGWEDTGEWRGRSGDAFSCL
jgi:hypothetical protein